MNNELSIKLFRLATGDDIISAFVEDIESNTIILQHPMKLVFRRIPTGATILAMMPWLPGELIKVDAACIAGSWPLSQACVHEDRYPLMCCRRAVHNGPTQCNV